jgi:hypothetical protein
VVVVVVVKVVVVVVVKVVVVVVVMLVRGCTTQFASGRLSHNSLANQQLPSRCAVFSMRCFAMCLAFPYVQVEAAATRDQKLCR